MKNKIRTSVRIFIYNYLIYYYWSDSVVCRQTHPSLYYYRFDHSVSECLAPTSYCFHSPVFHHSLFYFIPFPYLSLFYPPIYLCSRVVVTQCDTPVSRSPVTLMWPHGSSGLCIPYLCWSAEYTACMLIWICGCHTVWHASLSVPCHTDVTSWVFIAMYTLLMLGLQSA